jgi:cobalamin biosynthesis Mg chelatase CobN
MKLSATARQIHYGRQAGVTPFQLIVGLLVLVGLGVGGWCLMQFSGGGDKGGKKGADKTPDQLFADDLKDITAKLEKAVTDKKIEDTDLDALTTMATGLSETAADLTGDKKLAYIKIATEYAPKILPLLEKAAAIPGLGDKLKPVIEAIKKGLEMFKP